MRTAVGLSTIILVSTLARAEGPAAKPPETALGDRAKLLEPIQVDSLTLTPIVSTEAKPKELDLLVLDEAMPKKLVRIHEVDDGDVNNLTLTNNSKQPLFLLAGEVIIGGKQDRIIGRNTVIPAKTTQQVPVFCVEHGRWEGETKEFRTAKALAHGRLRGKASFEAQQDVWDEVHAKNAARKTTNETDTYRKIATETDAKIGTVEKRVGEALAKLPPEQRGKLVGFAVSLNGKVATVDVFQSPALFGKLQDKLVRSYVTEAIDVAAEKTAKPPTAKDVDDFMVDAKKAASEPSYETKAARTYVGKGKHADTAKVSLDPSPAAPAVYETYQAK